MNKSHFEIIQANTRALFEFETDLRDGKTKWHETEDFDILQYVVAVCSLAQKIGLSKDLIKFTCVMEKFSQNYRIETNNNGINFCMLLTTIPVWITRNFQYHEFNPYMEIFLKVCEKYYSQNISLSLKPVYDIDNCIKIAKVLEGLAQELSDGVNTRDFKKKLESFLRTSEKNYRSGSEYIDRLYKKESNILIVRLDLYYKKSPDWFKYGDNNGIGINEVQKNIDKLLRYVRYKTPDNAYIGYMLVLHRRFLASYNFHLVLFMDANKLQEGNNIAKKIADHWVQKVTGGRGLYFNYNDHLDSTRFKEAGVINPDNEEGRSCLRRIITYLTMTNIYFRLRQPKGIRVFRKGIMPAEKKVIGGCKHVVTLPKYLE